jgi:hypothetical protein
MVIPITVRAELPQRTESKWKTLRNNRGRTRIALLGSTILAVTALTLSGCGAGGSGAGEGLTN